jgi:hypothetical protein
MSLACRAVIGQGKLDIASAAPVPAAQAGKVGEKR